MAAQSTSSPTVSQELRPGIDFLSIKLQRVWLVAEIGRLRLPFAQRRGINLPAPVSGGQPVAIATNDGSYPKYIRVYPAAGAGSLTFFNSSTSMSAEGAFAQNIAAGVDGFIECVMMPSEKLYAQNQGLIDFRVIVFEVSVPVDVTV